MDTVTNKVCCSENKKLAPYYNCLTSRTKAIFDPSSGDFNIRKPSLIFNLKSSNKCNTKIKMDRSCQGTKGQIEQNFKLCDNTNMTVSFNDASQASVSVSNKGIIPNGGITASAKTDKTAKLSLGYRHSLLSTNLDLLKSTDGKVTLSPALTLFLKDFALGTRIDLNVCEHKKNLLNDYNLATCYSYNKSTFSLYTKNKATNLNAELMYNLCKGAQMAIALSSDIQKRKNTSASVGAKIAYGENLDIHAKVCSLGWLNSVFTHRISDTLSLAFFSKFNLLDNSSGNQARMGLRFEINSNMKCHD